jgi:hypothetical protein
VHLHHLVILEVLSGTPSKHHRHVTLGGVVVLIVRGSRLPHRSGKGDDSRIKVLNDFLST